MMSQLIAKLTLTKIFNKLTGTLISKGIEITTTVQDVHNSLSEHMNYVLNWSDEISFNDLKRKKKTNSVYVELDLSVMPLRYKINKEEELEQISIKKIIKKTKNHLVILGQPGAGKTTSMKMIAGKVLKEENFAPHFNFPIVIRLREYNSFINFNLFEILSEKFKFKTRTLSKGDENEPDNEHIKNANQHYNYGIISLLEELSPLIIFDGFDELSNSKKEIFLDDFELLTKLLMKTTMLLTSRTADFPFSLDKVEVMEICSLNDDQINRFASKWLKKKSSSFLSDIKKTPFYDTAVRPLTIAHLCAIYERVGKIPEKPKTVYRKVVQLLLEDWDEQRRVKRDSQFSSFEYDRKQEFLSRLAYELAKKSNDSYFSKDDIISIYNEIHVDFDLEDNDSKSVLNEIESHSGLFLQVASSSYEFSHKSIQEYLIADYLLKLPEIESDIGFLIKIPNELAITISISSNSSLYFCKLVNVFFDTFLNQRTEYSRNKKRRQYRAEISKLKTTKFDFMMSFINRLWLS